MSPRILAIIELVVTLCAQNAGPAKGVNAKPPPPYTSARTVNSGQAEATVRVGFTIVAPT